METGHGGVARGGPGLPPPPFVGQCLSKQPAIGGENGAIIWRVPSFGHSVTIPPPLPFPLKYHRPCIWNKIKSETRAYFGYALLVQPHLLSQASLQLSGSGQAMELGNRTRLIIPGITMTNMGRIFKNPANIVPALA